VIPRFVSIILTGERPDLYGDGNQSRGISFTSAMLADANLLSRGPNRESRVGRSIRSGEADDVERNLLADAA